MITNRPTIPLASPYIGDDEMEAVKCVLANGCPSGTCPEVALFEEEFAEYIGSKHAVAVSSCTAALHLACLATGVDKHSTVVVPAFTFPATAYAPLYCGAKVVFADVHEDTYNIDIDTIPDSVCPTHIIPVHCFGNPCYMDEIMDYAEDYGAYVIEDSACAVASVYSGRLTGHTGTIGDVGCYSFYGIKELCTGEGGMLVTDNEDIASLARSLSHFGITAERKVFERVGYNYRLSAIQAAVGRVQLRKLEGMRRRRERVAEVYDSYISKYLSDTVRSQRVLPECMHSYQRYTVRLIDSSVDRDKVIEYLNNYGVQAGIGTYDVSSQPVFGGHYCPVSTSLYHRSISLPMHPNMDARDALCVMGVLSDALMSLSCREGV